MNLVRMPECVVLVGLQGAGKTTLYRERFGATHTHVSKDLWPNARNREARQRRLLAETLAAGRSVVVDNTNPRAADRAPLVAIGRSHGARLVAYYFDVGPRAALARNAKRPGRARVPPVAVFTTAKRLEPPTREEGFDALYRVTLDQRHTLVVTEL
jgi:predicted kinase